MTRPSARLAGLLLVAALVVAGSTACVSLAAGGNPIINDCQLHGQLTQNYSLAQLQYALHHIPPSVNEYGNCYDVIQEAIIHKRKGEPIGPVRSGGGSFLPTPVIIILVVLVLAALAFTGMALRARRMDDDGGGSPPPPAAG
jgi:hypothetical protein